MPQKLQKYKYYEMLDTDVSFVQKAYENWEDSLYETPVDFIAKKRRVDLSFLLDDVIENELSEDEQAIIRMYYFEGLSVREIANEQSCHRSTVSRRLDSANLKIYKYLKYAVKYQYDTEDNDMIPLALREAYSISAIKAASPAGIGGRIVRLRILSNIGPAELSRSVGIKHNRLLKIESGSLMPTVGEIAALAAYFNKSTDYILTGKNEGNAIQF